MRLSEAIRKGCEITKPCIGNLINLENKSAGACALGAAGVGFYGMDKVICYSHLNKNDFYEDLRNDFPILDKRLCDFPENLIKWVKSKELRNNVSWIGEDEKIMTIIYCFNDAGEASRKALAMWVETLEDYLEQESKLQDIEEYGELAESTATI